MELVLYETKERVGYITLNRPEKRNALSPELVAALLDAFTRAENDNEAKVIVLRANGEAFCAGADLAYLQSMQHFSREDNLADSDQLKSLFLKIYQLNKVVIAQVHGHALAGGCGLANVCDVVFAVPEARFGYTEVKIGFVPAMVLVFLIRKIGEQRARHLLLSGDLVQDKEALAMGLVNFISTKAELAEAVESFAQKLVTGNSANSMALTKRMIDEVQSMPLAQALDYAAAKNVEARSSDDCKKGIGAFLSKEKIVW